MEPTLQDVSDQLGEAFHTALRKASDHPWAHEAWWAIKALPAEEWAEILDFVRASLGLPVPTPGGADAGTESP